jgi:P27 family predicted phage terminase small subunit
VRGRTPVPTAMKILRGNPGRRPLNSSEPEAPLLAKLPTAPKYLGRIAKKEWRARVQQLAEMRMLAGADLTMLGRLCVWHERFVLASTKLNKLKPELAGSMTAVNLQNTMSMASKAMKGIEEQFGFSPASRSRIKVGNPKQEDLFGGFHDLDEDDDIASEPNLN